MSITFTPSAGVVTTYTMYLHDTQDRALPGDDIANGVIRFANDEPSLNMANGNALHFIERLGLCDPDQVAEAYVGQLEADRIDALLERVHFERAKEFGNDNYVTQRLDDFMRIALHCKYHGCGFTWG